MSKNILYTPMGRKTFDLKEGEKRRTESSGLLNNMSSTVVEPEGIITSTDELGSFLSTIDKDDIDFIVYQSVTFADAEGIKYLIENVNAPVIVWSIREPEIGGWLHLNSLTGGNSTCHYLEYESRPYSFILGNPDEPGVVERLKGLLDGFPEKQRFPGRTEINISNQEDEEEGRVGKLIERLKSINIGVLGEHPPGFFFSDTDDDKLQDQLGVTVKYYDLENAFEECMKIPREKWEPAIDRAEKQVIGLNRRDETVERFAQFTTYVKEEVDKENLTGIAVRCYPEFFNKLGAAACSTLSQFTEDGIVSACESDIHGSISMYILQELSGGSAPYLGDLVHVNKDNNSAVFWHCGAGAYSLAHPEQGAQAGVHPNRKLGFTMEFGLKPGGVTIFRVGYTPDGYRLLIMRGTALDTPKRFNGTSVEVQFETDITQTVSELIEGGMEPHYAIVYADITDELVMLGHQLGLETILYRME